MGHVSRGRESELGGVEIEDVDCVVLREEDKVPADAFGAAGEEDVL